MKFRLLSKTRRNLSESFENMFRASWSVVDAQEMISHPYNLVHRNRFSAVLAVTNDSESLFCLKSNMGAGRIHFFMVTDYL